MSPTCVEVKARWLGRYVCPSSKSGVINTKTIGFNSLLACWYRCYVCEGGHTSIQYCWCCFSQYCWCCFSQYCWCCFRQCCWCCFSQYCWCCFSQYCWCCFRLVSVVYGGVRWTLWTTGNYCTRHYIFSSTVLHCTRNSRHKYWEGKDTRVAYIPGGAGLA